jgi:glycosyltransferase involved in cell wall biosynthesis
VNVCLDLTPLLTTSRWRGIGSYVLGLARALARLDEAALGGLRLHALVGPGRTVRVEPLDVRSVDPAATGADGPVMADPPYYVFKQTLALWRLARARMDLFHSTEPKGTPRPPRCLTIATCHDLIPVVLRYPFEPRILPTGARRLVELVRYRTFDHVVAISEATRRDLEALLGLRADRVSVVPNGVDAGLFNPHPGADEARRVADLLGNDRPYLLYVGAFDPRKRVPELVEAFGERCSEIDENLVLVGALEAGPRAALEARLRALPDRRRVVLLGHVAPASLPALYRRATAHVLNSLYEGFGLTLVEALSCGCPVVAVAASSVPEVVGDAALLVDPADPGAIGGAMARISTDAALRRDLAARGIERARRFTWERCAEDLLGVYRRVLGGGAGGVTPRRP